MQTERLEWHTAQGYKGIDYLLVFPPSLAAHVEIEAHYQELRQVLDEMAAQEKMAYYLLPDSLIYPRVRLIYQRIAQLFKPAFDPTVLTVASRRSFFIAGPMIPVPGFPDQEVPGLSGLQRLLGYTQGEVKKAPGIILTSGNLEVDVMAEVALSPIAPLALEFRQHFSASWLLALVRQMVNRANPEEAARRIQQEKDQADYEANRAILASQIEHMGLKWKAEPLVEFIPDAPPPPPPEDFLRDIQANSEDSVD